VIATVLGGLVGLVATGCAAPPSEPQPPGITPAEYADTIAEQRRGREERLTGEYNWLSVVGLHWLEQGENSFGSGAESAILLPAGSAPETAGSFVLDGSTVTVATAAGVELTRDGAPVADQVFDDVEDGNYGPLDLGRLRMYVVRRQGRTGIRVRDPESPTRVGFRGIDYYPVAMDYRVLARFEAFDTPLTAQFPNAQGWVTDVEVPGELVFELQGQTLRLLAQETGEPDEMFLIFKDGTSADETYAAGRYLYTEREGEDLVIDFNKAYNPPCAFTAFATCSYPPPRNRLAVRIEAGEKRYAAH
jgi:uncharacterized protein (DUF1684 family)